MNSSEFFHSFFFRLISTWKFQVCVEFSQKNTQPKLITSRKVKMCNILRMWLLTLYCYFLHFFATSKFILSLLHTTINRSLWIFFNSKKMNKKNGINQMNGAKVGWKISYKYSIILSFRMHHLYQVSGIYLQDAKHTCVHLYTTSE